MVIEDCMDSVAVIVGGAVIACAVGLRSHLSASLMATTVIMRDKSNACTPK